MPVSPEEIGKRVGEILAEDKTTVIERGEFVAKARMAQKLARAEAHIDAIIESVRKADETLACMWSSSEESRANLTHTCSVQASDILRALLEEPNAAQDTAP